MGNGIIVVGATFVDIKGFPHDLYVPTGRNVGHIEYIHGGVARNVAEDIANAELRPTFLSIVDNSALGTEVVQKLKNHKVNTDYILAKPDGMGTWLAVFDNNGDVAGSISKRPNLRPILDILEEQGEEIFSQADSVVLEVDIDKATVKKVFELAEKHDVKTYAVVSNMSIAIGRRDFFQKFDCFICNEQEAFLVFRQDAHGAVIVFRDDAVNFLINDTGGMLREVAGGLGDIASQEHFAVVGTVFDGAEFIAHTELKHHLARNLGRTLNII